MRKFLLVLLLLPRRASMPGLDNYANDDGRFSIGGELAVPTGLFGKQQGIRLRRHHAY